MAAQKRKDRVGRSGRLGMGELEAIVMDVLWSTDGWWTPGEVQTALAQQHEVAYTTVMTILVRLTDKLRAERHRDGRSFAYRATQSRDEYAATQMRSALAPIDDR